MCAQTCWAVDSSHEMFLSLHHHSSALEMLQSWMILLPLKTGFKDNFQTIYNCCSELVSYLQKPSCLGYTATLSFICRHEGVAIGNDKLLLSHKWVEKVLAGFRPPWDGRAEAASPRIVRGWGKCGLQQGADAVSRSTADILTGKWEARDGWEAAGQAGRWKVNHSHMRSVWLTSGLCCLLPCPSFPSAHN